MESYHTCSLPFLRLLFLFVSLFSVANAEPLILPRPFNNNITAAFVFGDSTVDPGNNNYVQTLFRSNFPPYGMDFRGQTPTGRFTNGKLSTDLVVSYIGIKEYLPPYLDPNLSIEEMMTGVSFASAGTGLDPLTAQISVGISPFFFLSSKRVH
ncbi:hypothetical protein V6N13_076052 [Hibiscus sabdariffa]